MQLHLLGLEHYCPGLPSATRSQPQAHGRRYYAAICTADTVQRCIFEANRAWPPSLQIPKDRAGRKLSRMQHGTVATVVIVSRNQRRFLFPVVSLDASEGDGDGQHLTLSFLPRPSTCAQTELPGALTPAPRVEETSLSLVPKTVFT